MRRLTSLLFAVAIALLTAISQAGPAWTRDLPGEDDPRLQLAIDAWLAGEDLAPITEMADLARDGNVAARLLLWKLEYRANTDLPDLSREDHLRLFRAPTNGRNPKRWAETEELQEFPFLVDWWKVAREKDPEVWLRYARRMIAAGEREHVLVSGAWRTTVHPFLAEFLDEVATVDDYHQVNIWLARWHAHIAAEMFPDSAPEYWFEGWSGPPWAEEQEALVRKSFGEKRIAALEFLRWRNLPASETPISGHVIDRTHDRSAELWDWLNSGAMKIAPPTLAERRTAGALLVAEARHGTYLTPLLDICEARCAQTMETCVYAGVVNSGGLASLNNIRSPLEAIISQDRWRRSSRARRDVLYLVRQRLENAEQICAGQIPSGQ